MTSAGEDLQPNELRLNRKGSANVPSVKVTTSRPGPSNYRGHILSGSNPHRGIEGRNKTRRSNNVSEFSRTATPSSSFGYSKSSFHTPSDALPPSFPRGVKREAASPDLVNLVTPPKRPRHWGPLSLDLGHIAVAKRPPNENSITVDLPFNCWKGSKGYKEARKNWIGVERIRVEREHKVRFSDLQYLDKQVVFFCNVERPPETRCIVKRENQDTALITTPKPPQAVRDRVHHRTLPSNATASCSTLPQKQNSSGTVSTRHVSHNLLQHPPHHAGTPTRPSPEAATRRIDPKSNLNISYPLPPSPPVNTRHQLAPSKGRRQEQSCQTPTLQRQRRITAPFKTPPLVILDTLAHLQHGNGPQRPLITPLLPPEDLRIPQESYDKTRRVLISPSRVQLMSVTMHGIIDNANIFPLRHNSCTRTPANPTQEHIDDACIVRKADGFMVVVGHARDNAQISLLAGTDNDNELKSKDFERPRNPSKRSGVSVLCTMMQPLKFSSGGYDHIIHLWDAREEDSVSATSSQLSIKHSSVVQSLLPIRDTSHKLVSACAGGQVNLFDLSSERVVNSFKVSGSVYNCHTSMSPFCTLLEVVAHREIQFEIRDYRMVPEIPVQRFGYDVSEFHGRFIKGDTGPNLFACGGRDGRVRIWDIRHSKTPFVTLTCFKSAKVIQVMFEPERSNSILACSTNNEITRMRYTLFHGHGHPATMSKHSRDVDEAHDLQIRAGLKGAAQFTAIGLGAVTLTHHTWPLFRRQTLAFKAFLVSAFTMFGLVVMADDVLLKHEAVKRQNENAIRKEARYDMARRGIIPTETAIRAWKAEREKAAKGADDSS